MSFLNKLERKFGRYAIKGLMRYVIVCYIVGYALQIISPQALNMLTLEPYLIIHQHQFWRLISWVLLPPSRTNLIFAIIMIVLYYQLGKYLEQTWGAFKFNLYIFGGVIYTIIGAMLLAAVYGFHNPVAMGGAFTTYYINMSIFLAFALCFPETRVMLYFFIPIKMKWMALVYGALIIYNFVITGAAGRVAIVASLINFLIFIAVTKNLKQTYTTNRSQYHRQQQFKKQATPPPRNVSKHKCAICGRTELTHPELQFRFCSKCNGNYEYCQDHLFTHTHK